MYNKLTSLPLTAVLTSFLVACGGQSDSTSGEEKQLPEFTPPVLSINAGNASYIAIQRESSDWQQLTLTNHTLSANVENEEINIAVHCDGVLEVKQLTLNEDEAYNFNYCGSYETLPRVTVELASDGYRLLNTLITHSWGEESSNETSTEIILTELISDHTLIVYGQRESDDKIIVVKQENLALVDDQVISIDFTAGTEASVIDVTVEAGLDYYAEYISQVGNFDNLDLTPYQLTGNKAVIIPEALEVNDGYYSESWSFGDDSGLDRVVTSLGVVDSGFNSIIPEEYTQASFEISQDKKTVTFEERIPEGLGLKSDFIEFDLNDYQLLYNVDSTRLNYIVDNEVSFQLLDLSVLPGYTFDLPTPTIDSIIVTTYSVSENWPEVGSTKLLLNTSN